MRRAAVALALATTAACGSSATPTTPTVQAPPEPAVNAPPADPTGQAWFAALAERTATTQRATRSYQRPRPPQPSPQGTTAGGDIRAVSSTAYCEHGTTASGQPTGPGMVAMNGVPMGSRWRVVETGNVYLVADRIGHGSDFDIWLPSCAAADNYGRRTVHVERAS